jgi:two-component system NtrC family sensor kinase
MAIRRIAIRLALSFFLIIVIISAMFSVVGIRFIEGRFVVEAEGKVESDLNAARELYLAGLNDVYDVIRLSANRFYLREALLGGDVERAAEELRNTWIRERLDFLTIADGNGIVLLRATNPNDVGDSQADDQMVERVLASREPLAATAIVPGEVLRVEAPHIAEIAESRFVETPEARPTERTEETAGMVWKAAAPIFSDDDSLIGVLYGGHVLNRRFDIVDKVQETVFRGALFEGRNVGDVTIFQEDARISTTFLDAAGQRALGTRVDRDVYERVIAQGERRTGRASVVGTWYLAAYDPIRDIDGNVIGMLGVGVLEEPYLALKRRTSLLFLGITMGAALLAIVFSILISKWLAKPVRQLVAASREVAHGNLDARVEVSRKGELADVARAFNYMTSAVKARDDKLREYAKNKILESERLAIIGQLAADVAHELNNPLQGIVAYSHLLLEKLPQQDKRVPLIEKIVRQAVRCTTIVRGLLDFSRPRKPVKKLADVNRILEECLALVENQSVFHNIEIVKNVDDNLPEIVIDASQVQQVFMNLIINAAEAMSNSGRLTVSGGVSSEEDAIVVTVSDTGHGIDEENIERIFDPFFTTKEAGHGTGLGLAISYGIIKEHDGQISVVSEPGYGTTFMVQLPVTAENGQE